MEKSEKLVWHGSIGCNLWVEYNTPLYNGYTVQEIENKLKHLKWHEEDKKRYLSNVKQVIDIQMSGVNLNEIEGLKNQNFAITKFYLEQNN